MNLNRYDALQRQVERLSTRLLQLERLSRRLSGLRLTVAVALLITGVLALTSEPSALFLLMAGASALSFAFLVVGHRRVKGGIKRFTRWRQIKNVHIARLTLDWEGLPPTVSLEPHAEEHPFDFDLDVTGDRSLHHLLDTAVTYEGSDRLRRWLLTTLPDIHEIRRRQALVKELKTIPNFRDKLPLFGAERRARSVSTVLQWLNRKDRADTRILLLLCVFALVNPLLVAGDALGVVSPVWRLSIPLYFITFLFAVRRIGDVFQDSLTVRDNVETFNAVFRNLETFRYGNRPELKKLCVPFLDTAQRPTRQLLNIRWLLVAASLRSNVILWFPLNLVLPWDLLVAWGLDRLRSRLEVLLPKWLDVWFDLEALCSLATYADHHPDAVFPTLDEGESFDGRGLGHPLIREKVKIRNDFALSGTGKVVIITGSNMSGKSSFLRTVGLALCMAYAGGVVDAASLRVSAFRLFTCIRVSDSVVEGYSYFYAEVRRLKWLLDVLDSTSRYPVFFLIDEIFKGTNNRERFIGSRSYIRAVAGKTGLGLISTHDLELAQLEAVLPGVSNMHFQEQFVDERMVFDYKLRGGVSPTTNALKIMSLAGLPVEFE